MDYKLRQVTWELTLKCNLRCIHCGSNAGEKRRKELTTKEALDVVKDLADLGVDEICFLGGEPFLRKDWFEIANEAKEFGIRTLFISNGCINKNVISKLCKLEPYGVAVSIDGMEKVHDAIRGRSSFKKAISFLLSCKDNGLPMTIITTVNKLNLRELPKIKDFIIGKNIAWQIQIASPQGRLSMHLVVSEEEFYAVGLFIAWLRKKYSTKELPVIGAHCCGYFSNYLPNINMSYWKGCSAGINILGIKSNGDTIGCLSIPEKFIEGNLRRKGIKEIWNDNNAFSYNRKFNEEQLGTNCKGCKYWKKCKGGCNGLSFFMTNQFHNDPYCYYRIEKKFFKLDKI